MLADDTAEGEQVEGEEGRAKDGSLGDTTGDRMGLGFFPSQGDVLGSVGEVGLEPI